MSSWWRAINSLLNRTTYQNGSRTIGPDENCPPTPKLTLTQTLTLTRGQFPLAAIVWLPPNPKINPNLDPNPNPNRGQFSLGGNCPDTYQNTHDKKKECSCNLCIAMNSNLLEENDTKTKFNMKEVYLYEL